MTAPRIFLPIVLATTAFAQSFVAYVDNTPVCLAEGDQSRPEIVADGSGGAIVVWQDGRRNPDTLDLYVQRVSSNGVPLWTTDGVVAADTFSSKRNPVVVADGAGGAIIIWEDRRAGEGDLFAQRMNGAGERLWGGAGKAVCLVESRQFGVAAVEDGEGGALVFWHDERRDDKDVYGQRIDANGELRWDSAGVALCDTTGDQAYPVAVSDGLGGAAVAWNGYAAGDADVFAQRIDGTGNTLWRENGVIVSAADRRQLWPSIAANGAATTTIAWFDERERQYSYDVYAQRLGGDGSAKWTADGEPVSVASGNQIFPAVYPNGTDVTVVWEDERAGVVDVYMQRLDENGAVSFVADGAPIAEGDVEQSNAVALSDADETIVAWEEAEGTAENIRVQKFDATGAAVWNDSSLALADAPSRQTQAKIASDGNGGAVVVWTDRRDSLDYDIYMQRVNADGTFPVGVRDRDDVASSFRLYGNYPNPFNPVTTIEYSLKRTARVELAIFNALGERVEILVNGERAAGEHRVRFDGSNLASGVYFYRLSTPFGDAIGKAALVK